MKIFAISDLHMPGKDDKPMNVFGNVWDGYLEKIEKDWNKKVSNEDIVLLPGDLSWAMYIEDVDEDMNFLARLPGRKVLCKGNHDYWWTGISKVNAILPGSVYVIYCNAIRIDNVVICGTRGWTTPGCNEFTAEDNKIYLRETERLKLSLSEMNKIKQEGDRIIGMMHYPPFNVKKESSNFTDLFEKYGIKDVVYGHIHGTDSLSIKKLYKNDVTYYLTSCDQVSFELQEI